MGARARQPSLSRPGEGRGESDQTAPDHFTSLTLTLALSLAGEGVARRLRALLLALVLIAAASAAAQQAGGVRAAWVELTPGGAVLRAVTDTPECPRVTVATPGASTPPVWQAVMTLRAAPALPSFSDRVCEWIPPTAVPSVAVEGWRGVLRLQAPDPQRIVVLGDSGCLGAVAGQDCATSWYLPVLARLAAARRPDLVVHLGDYNYRGTNCIAYDGCCAYDKDKCSFPRCGDDQATWEADFFAPAAPLLAAAPWLMLRGNHELCSRAGLGYFRYLDPHMPPPTCAPNPVEHPTYTDPYVLPFGPNLRLLVLDSANACDQRSERDHVARYRAQFARAADLLAGGAAAQTWLVTHRPLWGVVEDTAGHRVFTNYTLQEASGNRLPASIGLVLSGHDHVFQSLSFDGSLPPALIVGTGGVALDPPGDVPARIANLPLQPGGPTIASGLTLHDHGYLLLERDGTSWSGTFYDRFDQPRATCTLAARPVCSEIQRQMR